MEVTENRAIGRDANMLTFPICFVSSFVFFICSNVSSEKSACSFRLRRIGAGFFVSLPLSAPLPDQLSGLRPDAERENSHGRHHTPVPEGGRSKFLRQPRVPVFQRHNRKGIELWRHLSSPCSN